MKHIYKNWQLALIGVFYLLSRFIGLKLIPIFTDEAIYSYWAQVALHDPANRFISLEDGKQPLFIWLAAILQKFIADPLIAGRIVSITAGLFSIFGIYLLTRELFDEKVAKWAAALYVVLPFPLLYDKLGIYDSLLTMLGIYSVYFTIRLVKKPSLGSAFLTGFAIGGAYITKSSAAFFLYLLPASILLFDFKKPKVSKRLFNWLKFLPVTFILIELMYNSLRLSPLFYIIKRKNFEFIKSLSEILANPIQPAISNFQSLAAWLINYTTWPLLLIFLASLIFGITKKDRKVIYLTILIIVPFLAETVFNKILYPRFMLFYYPYLVIITAWGVKVFNDSLVRYKSQIYAAILILALLPAYTSFKLLTQPAYANIPQSDSNQYFNDWPAGYGVNEVVSFLKEQSQYQQVYVGTQGTFGIFPFALNIYFRDNLNIHIFSYWPVDPKNLPREITNYAKSNKTFFIFNENQQEIDNPNLRLIAKYRKGKSNSYMRFYEIVTE